MSYFQDLITNRRSTRKFTEEPIAPEQVELILKAALKSPTSKNACPWQFLLIEQKDILEKLSHCKKIGSKPIAGCSIAIVVMVDPLASDVWIEDASIASILMQMQAEDLGLGSCWIQIRERYATDDTPSDIYVRNILDIPLQLQILSIIVIGHKEKDRPPFDETNLLWEKVHIDIYK